MTPPDRPLPDEIPWELLEQLAAEELAADDATALGRRIAHEPRVRAAYERVRRVEEALRAESLWTEPVGLSARILAHVVPEEARPRPLLVFARIAAAVLVFCSSWLAFSGSTPAVADVTERSTLASFVPSGLIEPIVPLPSEGLATKTALFEGRSEALGGAIAGAVVGLALLGLGLFLLLRWHARAATSPGAKA